MDEVIKCIDANNDCVLQKDEFYDACVSNPLIFECFIDGIFCAGVVSPQARIADSAQRNKLRGVAKSEHFSWSTVQMLWSACLSAGAFTDSVGLKGFKNVMSTFFSPSSQVHHALLERMFTVFDLDGDGTISLREFVTGLATILRGSVDEQARFYFHIFDMDGDGAITRDEMYKILCIGKEGTTDESSAKDLEEQVNRVLTILDEDGNGEVDCEEYVAAALCDSEVLEVFERCLFGSNDSHHWNVQKRRKMYKNVTDAAKRKTQKVLLTSEAKLKRMMGRHPRMGRRLSGGGEIPKQPRDQAPPRERRRRRSSSASVAATLIQRASMVNVLASKHQSKSPTNLSAGESSDVDSSRSPSPVWLYSEGYL